MSLRSQSIQGLYLVLVGVVFVVEGMIMLGRPVYWDAVTSFDYAAVWTHSLVLLLVAPALIILVREARAGRAATVVAWMMAAGAVVSAVANAVEDAFHVEGFGTLYVIGAVPYAYGTFLLTILLALGARKTFALVPAVTALGLLATDAGGSMLIGLTWAIFGLLVLMGRTEPDTTAASPSLADMPTPDPPAEAPEPT